MFLVSFTLVLVFWVSNAAKGGLKEEKKHIFFY